MDQFFQPHRKFSWPVCGLCSGLAVLMAVLLVYGGLTIAGAVKESRENEREMKRKVLTEWTDTYSLFEGVAVAGEIQGIGERIVFGGNDTDDYRVKGEKTYPHFKLVAYLALLQDYSGLSLVPNPSVVRCT